ncbi:hypothetical protein D3C75_1279840 [compost metagenome]
MHSGRTMLQRIRKCPAPSIRADSSKLAGMLLIMELFIISRLNALKDTGKIRDQMVSSMPRLFISM